MTTYTSHFGLNNPPFAALAAGPGVFVSPKAATTLAALKKALSNEDAAVCVTGPAGVGKTTVAKRALDSIGQNRGVVTIGRMPFGPDEVLEILLAGLGARQLPNSTVHRFALFRRMLQQFAEQNTRVFILVEDAPRIGADTLSELEALTAADAGVSNGANLVLLGDENLISLLREPKLARLKQRVRSRQIVEPQNESELQGYLKHGFRQAGREYDTIFSTDCCATLHSLSDGLPRVINNLVSAVLTAAAENAQEHVTAAMIDRVARDEFGLTGEHSVEDISVAIEQAAAPQPEPLVIEPEAAFSVQSPSIEAPLAAATCDDIPELIQDTLPDLEILAPELAAAAIARLEAEPEPKAEPEPVLELQQRVQPQAIDEPTENELPVLSAFDSDTTPVAEEPSVAEAAIEEPVLEESVLEEPVLEEVVFEELEAEELPSIDESVTSIPAEARDEDGNVPAEIPDWDRDPTFAELRPDLDALERAMAAAQGPDPDTSVAAEVLAQAPQAKPGAEEDTPKLALEITLDKQIQAKIAEAAEALKQTQIDATSELRDDSADPVADDPDGATGKTARPEASSSIPVQASKDAKKADQELEKIASDLARAKTIEDVDDFMAETLFGEEFSMLAAQVAANSPMQFETEVAKGTIDGEEEDEAVPLTLEVEEPLEPQAETMDTSASQRLQVLRDLNKVPAPRGAPSTPDASENIVLSGGGLDSPRTSGGESVDSIEDQITTSMTQTLKALTINPEPVSGSYEDDVDDGEERKGFFSRFRRK